MGESLEQAVTIELEIFKLGTYGRCGSLLYEIPRIFKDSFMHINQPITFKEDCFFKN